MKMLFAHPNFPGQFKHLIEHFSKNENNQIVFITRNYKKKAPKDVRVLISKPYSPSADSKSHQYVKSLENSAYNAQSVWKICNTLKQEKFIPDIIYAHPGWGDGILFKDIFPSVPYIAYMEFYYKSFGADVHFYPNSIIDPDRIARIRFKNATNLLNLEACDWAISPTYWQASLHPHEFHSKFSVLHEGIDTDLLKPSIKPKEIKLPNGNSLPKDAEIVTYVARNFEPYRGFEQVMRSISLLMKERNKAHFLMIGSNDVSYGSKLPNNMTYKEKMLQELELDHSRIHWFGSLPFDEYIDILSHSMAHIYLTIPFVLSWSVLESMSLGCPLIVSKTTPLYEVIQDKHNALYANFFDPADIANKVTAVLKNEELRKTLGKNARKTIIDNYCTKKILPIYDQLITSIATKQIDTNLIDKLKPQTNLF